MYILFWTPPPQIVVIVVFQTCTGYMSEFFGFIFCSNSCGKNYRKCFQTKKKLFWICLCGIDADMYRVHVWIFWVIFCSNSCGKKIECFFRRIDAAHWVTSIPHLAEGGENVFGGRLDFRKHHPKKCPTLFAGLLVPRHIKIINSKNVPPFLHG